MITGTAEDIVIAMMNIEDKTKLWDVTEHREKRSLSANSYFHAMCGKIAEKMRESNIEVKNQMISDYGVVDPEMGFITMKDSVDWKKVEGLHLHPTAQTQVLGGGVLYRVYCVMKGSHEYDTKEMARLIDGTIQEAINIGIPENEILTPNERAKMLAKWGNARKKDELQEREK